MKWPIRGPVTSKFGTRVHPVTGKKDRFHNGIDIAAVVGTPVISPADGYVTDVYTHKYGGDTLIIKHVNGKESRMCHLDKIHVSIGQRVDEGEHIANSGNTGRSTGPHLHYGIRDKAGLYLDPLTILQ